MLISPALQLNMLKADILHVQCWIYLKSKESTLSIKKKKIKVHKRINIMHRNVVTVRNVEFSVPVHVYMWKKDNYQGRIQAWNLTYLHFDNLYVSLA